MIYYFTGTDNSRHIAEGLAVRLNDRAVSIVGLNKAPVAAAKERIGLVFPIYAWGVAEPMLRFAKRLRIQEGAFTFAVATCGDEVGYALRELKRVFPWQSAYSIQMPNNYIPLYDVDEPDLMWRKLHGAEKRLDTIAREIELRMPCEALDIGTNAWLKTRLIRPLFRRFAMSTKPFAVGERCIGCGRCAKECPAHAIELDPTTHKPVWHGSCFQCMRCYHHCPTKAIGYGKSGNAHGFYFYPDESRIV